MLYTPPTDFSVEAAAVTYVNFSYWIVFVEHDRISGDSSIKVAEFRPSDSSCQPCQIDTVVASVDHVTTNIAVTSEDLKVHIVYNIKDTCTATDAVSGGMTKLMEGEYDTTGRGAAYWAGSWSARTVEDPSVSCTNHGVRSLVFDEQDTEFDLCWTATVDALGGGALDLDHVRCATRDETSGTWGSHMDLTTWDSNNDDHPGVTFDDVTGHRRVAHHSSLHDDVLAQMWKPTGSPPFEYVDLNGGFGDLGEQDNPYMENTQDDWLLAVFDEPTDANGPREVWLTECRDGDAVACTDESDWYPDLVSVSATADEDQFPEVVPIDGRYFVSWDNVTEHAIMTANRCYQAASFTSELLTPSIENEINDRLGKPHIATGLAVTGIQRTVGVPARRLLNTNPEFELVFYHRRIDNMSACPP